MFSLEKYMYRLLGLIGTYVFCIFCGLTVGIVKGDVLTWTAAFALGVGMFMVPMIVYYVYLYIVTKKKFETGPKLTGVVSNWRMGEFSRMQSYLLVSDGEKEYETAAVFSRDDAPDYVGKNVSFMLIGEVAAILEVHND